MNATGCVTALGDGGEAFVVLLPDDRAQSRRRPEPSVAVVPLPPCPTASRPPPSAAPLQPYKSRPRRKDRGAFVVLPDPPAASAAAAASSASPQPQQEQPSTCSGRVSPFRGHGFKTPENGRSRAASPSSEPLKRQSSEPRIRRGPAGTKQRLSASTKDLSAAGKPPPAPAAKPSPRKKQPPATPRRPVPPKSPVPLRSPKTPRRSRTPVKPAAATVTTGTAATKPTAAAGRQPTPAARSSPRPSKKQPATKADASSSNKDGTRQPDDRARPAVAATAQTTTVVTDATTTASATTLTTVASTTSDTPPPSTVPQTAAAATVVSPVTASTSATAIATTHATNAVASPVVSGGGPIVTAAPPPAAIAANTLATLSVADPTSAVASTPVSSANPQRLPLASARPRDPPSSVAVPTRPAATVIVVDGGAGGRSTEATATQQSANTAMKSTTTPPLSYELQEIVVEPETENQSGRTPVRLPVDSKTLSTSSSSNGHKTVAWARPSEKIIVPAGATRSVDTPETTSATAAKGPAYKRFARKLCCGGRRRPPAVGKVTSPSDGRAAKCWAAVWKRRPRMCGRCCGRDRVADGRPKPTAAGRAPAASSAGGGRFRRWWRESRMCGCRRGKRPKKLASASTSSSGSVGALGIAPPNVRLPPAGGKLKRWLCCCCACCAVPKFVRRLCCCCACCGCRKTAAADDADAQKRRKSTDNSQRPSPFPCTGCCTNIPKLDAVFVDHSSVMKGAIPVLPITLAWLCLVFNVIIPGAGTLSSGMLCLCVGKPRFTVNDNFQSRVGAFCVNFIVAAAQLFTVLFCLVGWGWSIWWGVIMLKMAKKYQKVRVIDPPTEAPIAIDHNHQI